MAEIGKWEAVSDGKKRKGWTYADAVVGRKQPPPPPTQPEQEHVVFVLPARRNTRVFERRPCDDCNASGYGPSMKTPTGLEYKKVCKRCNGKGMWIDWSIHMEDD